MRLPDCCQKAADAARMDEAKKWRYERDLYFSKYQTAVKRAEQAEGQLLKSLPKEEVFNV